MSWRLMSIYPDIDAKSKKRNNIQGVSYKINRLTNEPTLIAYHVTNKILKHCNNINAL